MPTASVRCRSHRFLVGAAVLTLALPTLVACASYMPSTPEPSQPIEVTSAAVTDPVQQPRGGVYSKHAKPEVTRTSGWSVVQSRPVSGSVNLRGCSQLPNHGAPPQECAPKDILPDGSRVQMRCWKDTYAPTSQDPSYTSPRWFFVTEIDHHPGWSGWIYSAQIPVSEQIITPYCSDDFLNRTPIGDPNPPPPPPPKFAVVGSCTSAGGTLTGVSSDFSGGGYFELRASYPDGRPYPLDRTSGIVNFDGTVPWAWSCAGDPAGVYTTYVTDNVTEITVSASFTILPAPSPPPTPAPPTHSSPAPPTHSSSAPQPPPPTKHSPAPHPVKPYDNYGPANAGHAMCRGNPSNGASMPGGTVTQSFRVPTGVRSLTSALVQIDPDTSVTAHLTVMVDGRAVASTEAAASGDTNFSFGSVPVSAGQTVTLSISFTATYGKIITVYTAGKPGGTFSASNSCPDGASNVSTSSTGLRAVVLGLS